MACDAIVTAKNGNSSILYNSILEQVGSAEAALNIYLHITKNNIKSEQLDVNGEYVFTKEQIKEFDETVHNYEHPTVDMLLRYHRILKPLTNEDYELTSYPIVIEDGVVHKDALAALLHFEAPQYIMFSASTADEALNFLRRLNTQLQDESITNTIDYLEDQKRYLEKGVILTKDAYDNYDQYVKNADPSKLLSNTQLDIMLKATQAQLLTVSLDVAYTNMINGTYEAIYDKYLLGREPKARNFKSLEENIPPKYALVANDPIESGIIPIPSNLISGFSYNEEKYAINIVSTVLIQLASNLGSMKMKDALEGNTIKGEVIKYYYAILKNKPNLTASQKAVNAKVIRELQKDDSILWDKVKVEARVNSGFVITELDDLQFDPDDVSNSFDENLQFKVAPENRITAEVKTTINNIARLDPNNYTIVDGVRVFEKNTNNPGGLSTMMRASEVIPVLIQHTATSVNVEDMLNRIKQIGELSDPSYMVLYDKLVNNKELSNLFFSSIKSEAINRTTVKIQKENGEVTYKPIFQNKTSYIGYQIADNWLDNIKLKTLSKFYKNAGLLGNITNHYEEFKNKIGVSRVAEVVNLFNALGIPLTPHMVMTLIESANVPVGTSPSEKYKDSTNYQLDAKADIVLNAYFNNLVEGIMTYINEEGKSDFRQYGTLYRLANKLSIFIPPTTSAYMNIDGNQEQTFNKPTFISDWFNNMDNDEYFFELLSNMARDPKLIHSNWLFTKSENEQGFLAYAANEEGDTEFITDLNNIEYDRLVLNKAFYKGKKQAFKLDFFEGIEDTTIGFKARYTDITDDDWVYASVLNYFMADSANNYARYFLLTPADRGNTRTISAPRIPITNEDVGNGYVVSRTSHLHKAVYNIFLGELERMTAAYNHMYKLDENNNLIETPKEQLYVNYHYKDNKPGNAFNFHHFKYTDRKGKVQDLNEVISKLLPKDTVIDNRILANEEVMNAVNNFITKMMSFIAYSEVKQNSNNLSITTRFLDKRFGTSKSYRTAMTEYAINRYIAGVEMMNFFMGDIAFYASSDDANKRATEMLASGVANSHFGTNVPFYGVTIADRKITDTSIINSIRTVLKKQGHKQEIIDKIANAYRDFKGSDSQSYITYEEFKNRLELFGIKSQYNDLLARIEDEAKEINIEDLDAFVQLQKNFYYGYDFDETLSIFVPNQVKNTESVLVPRFIKGTELEKLDEAMKANEIVQVNFSSAEKTGSKYIANVTNENGDLNFDVLHEEFAKGKRKYYYKNLRKQQDVVNHMIDEDNKLGVQIAKKIIDNVNDPAVVKQLFDLYVSNIVESSNKLIEDFGITTNDNGEYEVDNKKLSDYLRQQYIQRGKNYNFLYGVQIDDVTGTLRAGLDYTPTLKTNLAAITSLFTNRIVNQKHPGSHGPHMTNAFMKAIAGGKNASQLPTRKDLKFTRFVDKNGELIYEAAEILLPHTAKAFFDNNVTIEDLQKAGLDTIVGYRIPTEDKHSMIVFKIVGFLDPAEGSTMVVPDGIVPQTGADFDFDSLYTMHYNFRVNPDGSISKINYSEDEDSIKDRYIGYVFSNAKRSTKTKIVEELKAAANRSYSAYKGQLTKLKNENKELNRDVMHQVFSFIDDIGSKVIVDDLRNNFEINMSGYGLNIQESMELLSIYISQQMEMMDRSVGAAIEYGLTEDAAKYASYVNKYASIKVMVSFAMEEFGMAKQTEKEYVDSIKQKMNDRYWNDFAYNTAVNVANLTGLPTITDFAKLPMTEQNGRKARENKILDIYIQILSDPTNYIEVATPNNMDDTNASKELADSFYNPAAEVLPYTAGGTQNSYRSKVLATRKLKGASVNRDSFVSIAQQIGLQLSTPIEVQFDTNEYNIESLRDIYGEENVSDEGVVRLRYFGNNAKGTFVNIDGKLITSYVAQTTAHILDSVKVPLPSNVNLLTFNIWRLIPELGGTWNTSTLFISQEAVSDIIAMDNKNKSISGINANKNPIKETKREILKKIYSLMLTNNDARANKIMTDALIAKHGKMSDKDLEARINKQKAYIFKSIKDAKLTNAVINSIEQLLDLPSAISDNDMKEALTNRTNYDSLSIENKIKYLSYQYFIASTYDQYSSISNEIRTFQQNTSFDKSSVGPDFFKINRFTNSVKTILENGTNLLDRNGDDYIRSIYENNSYPTINSYWEHGHEAARNVFASNFITESPAFRHFLSNYNEDIQKTAMYYAIAYNMSTLKFFSDTNKNMLFGLTAQPDLSKIDLTKINKETYEVFKNLSLVNKLLLVKEQYKDYIDSDNVLYYLQPNYKEGQRDNIAFVSDKDDDTFIYSFLKLWYNTNPYLHNLAQDLVKFAYFNNGMEFGRNVSKVIPLDILYNQPEVISEPYGIPIIKGIGYFSHLAKQRHANFNPEYEGIYDVFFRIKFARANYRSNKIVPIVKTEYDMDAQGHMTVRYGTPNWNNNDDFGIIHVSKYEFNTLSPNVKRADVVKRFVNREAKLYAKLEVNDEYYYIPVGKLEKYEFEDNSQITTNNVEHNIDYYIQIINGIDGNNINNETTEEETEIKPTKLRAKMTYAYGNNKRSDVTATTTLEAIKLGQRTATTRYESDKHINFWKNVKVGDIIEFTDNKETVLVEVTRPLNKLVYYTGLEEEWSKKEGWSVDYFRNRVSPRLNEAWQIEYKLVNNNSQPNTTSTTINFKTDNSKEYKSRTIKNASADATIVIASDYTTAGEKLTASAVAKQNKLYIPVATLGNKPNDLDTYFNLKNNNPFIRVAEKAVYQLNELEKDDITLNIAGNGIYTLAKYNYTQDDIDKIVYFILDKIVNSPNLTKKITSIVTGGQSGVDEAGAKAGSKLGIKTTVLAPKGWRFRDINNKDISLETDPNAEVKFKSRFGNIISTEPTQGKLFALVANDVTSNDFLNYNAARLNYLRSIVNDYNIRKSQFPTDKPIAETVTKLKKIDFGTKELSAQAAAFRIDADYIEKTIELFEKRLYGDTGYTKKEVFDSTIDTNDGRNGFVKFMNYSNTFLKGFERISTLEPIPGDNLSEEEQVINQAIERLLSFTPKISKIRATHTALMNAYFEATITPLSTNPEIKLGIRRLFDAQSDEGKIQLLLDSLGDTHNMFVANFIKRFITQRGIIRNTIRDLQRDYDTKIAEFEAKGFKLEDLLERDSQNRLTNKMIQEFDEAYKEDLENYRHRLIKIEGEFGKYSKEYYEAEREYKKWLLDNLSSEEVEELEKAKFDANDILYSNIEARRLIDRIKDEKNRILANYEGIIDYASISEDDAKRLVELGREEAAIANKYNADGTIKTGNALKISEAVTAYQTAWGEIIKKYYVQDYKAVKFGKLLEKNKNLDTKEAREWIARNTKPRIKDSFWDAFKHYAEVLGKEEKEDNDILKALKPFKDADGRVDGRLVPKELKAKIKEYNENRFKNEEEDKRRKTLKGIIKPKRDEVYNDEYYKEFEDNDKWGKDSRDTDVILIQYKNTIDQILSKYITDEGIVDTSAISYEDIRRINDLNDLIKIRGSVYTVNAARDIFNDWFNKNHETIIDKEAFKKAEAIAKSKGDKYYSQWKKLNTGVNINKTFYKRLDNLRKLYMPTTVTHPERTGTNIDMDAIREQYKVDSFDKLPDNVKATIIKNFQAKGSIYPGNTTTGRSLYTISDYLKKHRHKGKLVVMTDTESVKAYISELYERALTNETYRKNRKWTYRTAVEEQYTSTTTEEYKALLAEHGVDSEWYRNNHIINFRGGIEPVSYWLVRRPADKNMYQENAPSAKLWGYSTVTNKKYVDAVKSTAKKWMNDNTAFVTTEAYQQELINNKANMTEAEFKQWYDENHFYNPYTNTYQPISVWTTMLASKDYVNPTYPNDLFVENNVKEEYQNKEHRSINNEAMPKKTSKYYNKNFDKVKNNPLYQYITGLLNDLTLHYDKDTIAKEGKLPIMYKHTTSNAKEIAQSLIKKAGWYSYPSREIIGENNDSIRMLNMPFMSELMKEKEVPLPNRKEFKDEAEYFERYNAIVEQNKEIRKRNKEYNDAHMNRDFKQVLRMFIDAANSHKFTYEFEHEMRLALEQIRNLDMTKKRTMLEFLRNATKEKLKSSMPSLYEGDPALATKKGINSNLEAHFTAFMDMIFYGEFEEDEGNWTKIARVLQNYTSAKGMWLNTPGAFNNVAYGKTQIALERFSGYFFNNADRIKAEKLYWGASMSMVAELGKEKSNSFVNALIKEFDVVELQDEQAVTDNPDLNKAIIKKLLSANSMYFMHHMGEHYMQNVGLLSMLNSHRLVNGKIMSLTDYTYDARYKAILDSLPVERKGELITFITNNKNKDEYLDGRSDLLRDFVLMGNKELKADYLKHLETIKDQATKGFNGYTRLIDVYELKDGFVKVKEGYTVSDLEYHSFRRRVVSVNQKIHGIYNKLDAGTMQRKAIGRLAIQFKKWIRPGWIKRFGTRTGKSHWNESRGEKDMGMYVNTYKFLTKPIGDNIRRYKELRKSNSEEATVVNAIANIFRDYQNYISNIGVYWHTLTDSDKADIRRTMVESLYFIAVATAMWMLQGLADGDDDDKKWAYALYATDRLKTEILAYQPLYGFSNETRKLMRDPFAAMAAMDDLVKLLYTVMFESDDIYKGGIYHGETKASVTFYKTIPLLNRYLRYSNIESYAGYYKLY